MDDLISRAALLNEFYSLCGPQTGDGWDNMGVRNLIMRQKAVDAAPVVHGRWVDEDFPNKDANVNPRVTAICSKCGNIAYRTEHGYSILSKFCPNCGAKMDGERRDSE